MPTLHARTTRPARPARPVAPTRTAPAVRYATVLIDIDTFSRIDGIQWLAQRRGDVVSRKVASLADENAQGALPIQHAYGARLSAIHPRREDVDALSRAYVTTFPPGAVELIRDLHRAGINVALVSNSLRHALVRLALHLGVDFSDLHAVDVRFDAIGAYAGFDATSPLTAPNGKAALVSQLSIDGPVLFTGNHDRLTVSELRTLALA